MKSRILPAVLIAIVFIGIIAGFILSRSRTEPADVEDAGLHTPIEEPSPTSDATPPTGEEVGTEDTTADATPDLTTGADGLSKSTAVITTNKGVVRFKFYPQDAPNTVNRIIELIQQDFYDGLTFHRVVPGFVVQGGDPQGTGMGGSGQRLKAEFNQRRHVEGTVAMARAADPDSADSQFYIALGTQPHLDRNYTVFGQVVEGMDVVKKLQPGDKMLNVRIE